MVSAFTYRQVTPSDCETLAAFVNSTYRGDTAAQHGWTHENDLMTGERISPAAIDEIVTSPDRTLWLCFDQNNGDLQGCVCLQHRPESATAFLSMLTVRPDLQGRGLGKQILSFGEDYARHHWHVEHIELTIIAQRTELAEFYTRRGYRDMGTREAVPLAKFGVPKRSDLQFAVFRKSF